MEELKIFENQEFGQIRTLTIDDEPWFVGKDIAERLGYSKSQNAIAAHVDSEDKKGAPIQGTPGGTQQMTIINESGLYSLIFGSTLESAKRFKRWVTSEVLPAIRKTGSYSIDKTEVAKQLASCKTAAGVKAILSLYDIQPSRSLPSIPVKQNSVTAYLDLVEDWEITDVPSKKVYSDYCLFCKENKYRPENLSTFSKHLHTRGGYIVKRIRVNGSQVSFYQRE